MRFPVLLLLMAAHFALPSAAPAAPGNEALAQRLIDSQGCRACHRLNGAGVGAGIGPELDKVGSRLTREQLRAKLVNPQKRHANGKISDFSLLSGTEIDALVSYLETRK